MRNSILKLVFGVLFLLALGSAPQGFSREPLSEPFVSASDESEGGSSYLGVDTRDVTAGSPR